MSSNDFHDTATQDLAIAEHGTLGWDAMDQALEKVYGKQQPAHFGTLIKFRMGAMIRWTASASIAAIKASRTGTMSPMASAISMAIWTTAMMWRPTSPVAMVSS